ncbi:lysophospholipid acyltransferase family protein [Sporolactobacillus vineae]|uniref:lysophospholipid acyltransferase family protein n=1 Tax=Sporolactobacillus vineae TaxID=444463 RepID=UPI0002880E69|nr:lysophospholipid acyltransferase family protein [Sporolactobacillus vineae]
MNLYAFGKPIVKWFYRILFPITVEGAENIPESGGVLICCNHLSNFDPPFVGISMRRKLSFIAKEELFRVPLLKTLLRHLNAFPIKRGTGDRGAIRLAMHLLNDGHALLIFPEGHRNSGSKLRKGLAGAGFFALHTNAVIIPCAIIGRYKFRRRMTVVFGTPVNIRVLKEQSLRPIEVSAVIMSHIQMLLDAHASLKRP